MTKQEAYDLMKPISDKSEEIDPENELDWYSLTIGYLLAKGADPDDAAELASYIRYNTELC
jgi:hypothetical protein